MRSLLMTASATLLLASAGVTGLASAAFAGADDGGNKAFALQEASPRSSSTANARYTATYNPQEALPKASTEKDSTPWYFNHAMGTMGN